MLPQVAISYILNGELIPFKNLVEGSNIVLNLSNEVAKC